jgi:hypothetical protein
MTVETLVPRVREALGVSSSYDETTLPAAIRRAERRLLRDYNFPKSVKTVVWQTDPDGNLPEAERLGIGQTFFKLPTGMKRDLLVMYTSPGTNPPGTRSWSDPLKKLEGFRAPNTAGDALSRFYWLHGDSLVLDKPLYNYPIEPIHLEFTYQSWDVVENEPWLVEDFEDVIFILTVYRTAAEMRKSEVMQAYSALWQEEVVSLATYVNELEYDNLYMMMREATHARSERYPI